MPFYYDMYVGEGVGGWGEYMHMGLIVHTLGQVCYGRGLVQDMNERM